MQNDEPTLATPTASDRTDELTTALQAVVRIFIPDADLVKVLHENPDPDGQPRTARLPLHFLARNPDGRLHEFVLRSHSITQGTTLAFGPLPEQP